VRQDAIRPDPASLVPLFEPAVAAEPDAVRTRVALGGALIRSSQTDRGLALLEEVVKAHPDSEDAWDGLLTGLDVGERPDEFDAALARLPEALRAAPRFARHLGLSAQHRSDWAAAAATLRTAIDYDPGDFESLVRLARAVRFAGSTEEAESLDARVAAYRAARDALLPLYEEANAVPDLGIRPQPELGERLALSRESMLRTAEAEGWRVVARGAAPAAAPTPETSARLEAP
jgi:tetratricopeptide (TPR) repeat protein